MTPQDATTEKPSAPPPAMRFLRMNQVEERIGLEKRTVQRMVSAGDFPQPIQIHERAVGFLESEVDSWMAWRIALRSPNSNAPTKWAGWLEAQGGRP